MFNSKGCVVDDNHNVLVLEDGGKDLRHINTKGEVTTIAGFAHWLQNMTDGPFSAASFEMPSGSLFVGRENRLYYPEYGT